MLTNLHVLDLPESEKHNLGIMSAVCEHDNSKTMRATAMKCDADFNSRNSVIRRTCRRRCCKRRGERLFPVLRRKRPTFDFIQTTIVTVHTRHITHTVPHQHTVPSSHTLCPHHTHCASSTYCTSSHCSWPRERSPNTLIHRCSTPRFLEHGKEKPFIGVRNPVKFGVEDRNSEKFEIKLERPDGGLSRTSMRG
ncbi:hypothetical protein AVEN_54508-1 [Araneus ventricosus]|uniref:Uncharacterized protein n=1 Tax=Araneus ventricosus TaxID=182803 RepID=A0A4Y2EKP6_ARAVE|nr:hypothetical protein AVEN_54508-1 [Araneus ventricosus]